MTGRNVDAGQAMREALVWHQEGYEQGYCDAVREVAEEFRRALADLGMVTPARWVDVARARERSATCPARPA